MIAVRTHIGYGSPNRQTQKAHGSRSSEDEVRLTKEAYGWDPDRHFYVPDDIREVFERVAAQGNTLVNDWEHRVARYRDDDPDLARELDRRIAGALPDGWDAALPSYDTGTEIAHGTPRSRSRRWPARSPSCSAARRTSRSRDHRRQGRWQLQRRQSGRNLRSASGSTDGRSAQRDRLPRRVHPHGGTFLTFSDYMRGSVRLAAVRPARPLRLDARLDRAGEDGPTHQAVEHYAALRAIPNLWFVRPGDANETVAAWALAVARRGGPVGLSLTRQKLPTLAGTAEKARDGVARGGYVLRDASGGDLRADPHRHGLGAAAGRGRGGGPRGRGIRARVVSLPCWEVFEAQDQAYRDEVLPPSVRRRVSVEAGVSLGWERWVGDEGAIVGLDHFGASAPAGTVFKEFGFTVERVTDVARRVAREGLRGRIPTLHPGHLGLGGEHPSLSTGDPGVDRTWRRRSRPLLRGGRTMDGELARRYR